MCIENSNHSHTLRDTHTISKVSSLERNPTIIQLSFVFYNIQSMALYTVLAIVV